MDIENNSNPEINRIEVKYESKPQIAEDVTKYLNNRNSGQLKDTWATDRTHLIKENKKVLRKITLMIKTQNKIKILIEKNPFLKGLSRDEISGGPPHLWDGNGDLYNKAEYL